MNKTKHQQGNDQKKFGISYKAEVESVLNKLKKRLLKRTKYFSIPAKINYIKVELETCKDFEKNPDMHDLINKNQELEIFTGNVLFESNQLYMEYLRSELHKFELSQLTEKKQLKQSQFSGLEWATIFYYADETKLTSSDSTKIKRMEKFRNKHSIKTTFNYFKNKYSEAKIRINEKNDYPINKLEKIIPFLKENYKQTVPKVENDINYLTTEQADM